MAALTLANSKSVRHIVREKRDTPLEAEAVELSLPPLSFFSHSLAQQLWQLGDVDRYASRFIKRKRLER